MKMRRVMQGLSVSGVERWRFGPAAQLWYLKKRKKRRNGGSVVKSIPGLQLWLDAGAGALKSWDAAPASGMGTFFYGFPSGYTANGSTHSIRIFPYKYVSGVQVFSMGYLDVSVADDNSFSTYAIEWSWDAVPGADGYRVLKSDPGHGLAFDYSVDITNTNFIDSFSAYFAGGSTVTPNDLSPASDGDPVYLWQDQSGNGNDAVQTTWAARPSFLTGVVNGKPVLSFDAVDDGMFTGAVPGTELTAFAVYAVNDNFYAARRCLQGDLANWLMGPFNLQYALYTAEFMHPGPSTNANVFVAHTGWQTASASKNYVNGVLASSHSGASTAPGHIALSTSGGYPEALNGVLAEVIVYSGALADADRQAVEN